MAEQGQEALLERASSGVDLVDPPAGRDDRRNEVRDAARVERLGGQPVAVATKRSELLLERGDGRRVQAGREHADARVPEDLDEPSLLDDPPVVDDRHPVADALDLRQQVRVEEDRRAAFAGVADDRPDVVPPDRIEGRGRLVEDHEVRGAEERDPQPEALLHALREGSDEVLGAVGQADELEGRVDRCGPVRARQVGQVAVQRQHLPGAHPRLIAEQLGEVADPSPRRQVAERRAEDAAAAAARTGQAEQQLDDRRLARAVGAEQAEHLAALDGHREAVQRAHASVLLGEVDRLDRRAVCHRCPRCPAAEPVAAPQARTNASTGLWREPAARTRRRDRAG